VGARYAAGESSQVLADELGVSDSTVLARVKAAGVARRERGSQFTAEVRARVVAMYAAGATAREVGVTIGAAKPTVLKWVRRAGVEVREAVQPNGPRRRS
jgi:transposase